MHTTKQNLKWFAVIYFLSLLGYATMSRILKLIVYLISL